ncbi:MAG: hypothetical protein ABUL47_03615 [Leifsonia sp.]
MEQATGHTTGLTKDSGWEMGARKTVAVDLDTVWTYLTGRGLRSWLGADELPSMRSRTEKRRLRFDWTPPGTTRSTILQLTVLATKTGTTIAFHQERLTGREQRKEMLTHWHGVLEQLEKALT